MTCTTGHHPVSICTPCPAVKSLGHTFHVLGESGFTQLLSLIHVDREEVYSTDHKYPVGGKDITLDIGNNVLEFPRPR